MTHPNFTPDQLAAVFVARWKLQEFERDMIRRLRPRTALLRYSQAFNQSIPVGKAVRLRWREEAAPQ